MNSLGIASIISLQHFCGAILLWRSAARDAVSQCVTYVCTRSQGGGMTSPLHVQLKLMARQVLVLFAVSVWLVAIGKSLFVYDWGEKWNKFDSLPDVIA